MKSNSQRPHTPKAPRQRKNISSNTKPVNQSAVQSASSRPRRQCAFYGSRADQKVVVAAKPKGAFYLFRKLPTELRFMVWDMFLEEESEGRCIEVHWDELRDQYFTDAKLPTVLQINRESRAQGLKFYEILAISMIKIERDEAPGMVDWQVKWHNEEVNDQHEVEFKEFENPKDASYAGDSGRPYHQFRTYINYAADTLYFNDHHITVDPRNLTLIGIRFGRFQFNERERRLDGIKRFLSPIGENAIAQQKIQNLAFRSTKHWKKVLRKHSLAPVLMRLKSLQNFTLVLEDEYDSCSDEPHKPAKYFSDAALEKSRASREKRLSNAVSRIDEGFRSWEGVREFADVPEGSTAMKLNFSITGVVRE